VKSSWQFSHKLSSHIPMELQAARLRLVRSRPYLAAAVWALVPVEVQGLGSMAVDQWWRLYYDPEVIRQWSVEEVEGVLYHELCHLLREHAERLKTFPQKAANLAADAEINDDLRVEGVRLPDQPVYPEVLGWEPGKFAEEYLASMNTSQNQSTQQSQTDASASKPDQMQTSASGDDLSDDSSGSQPGDSSAQPGDPEGSSGSEADGSSGSEADGSSESQAQKPAPGAGSCGSCATGHKAPWELDEPQEGKQPGVSKADAELIRRKVAVEIQEHARSRGDVPGHWKRWADLKVNPKVDWRRQLAAAVRRSIAETAGMVDYSYRKPSRRQSVLGKVVLPGLRQPHRRSLK